MSQKVYARVVNGKIVEYPVFELHIKNRAHPIHWYTECIPSIKQDLPDEYSYYNETLELSKDSVTNKDIVRINYNVKTMSLQQLLNKVYSDPAITAVRKSDIEETLFNKISHLADEYISNKLDNFAKTKGYSDIVSLCSYRNDVNPIFAQEAQTGSTLRSLTWQSAAIYMNKLIDDTLPIPKSIKEIDNQLPNLVWE